MGAVNIDPVKLPGPWTAGFALERQHTIRSTFLGTDSFGHDQFDTTRSELGELVFRLKNRNDRTVLDQIAETAEGFMVDDLYRSGATATVVAQELQDAGAAVVYLLAMTKTRTRT